LGLRLAAAAGGPRTDSALGPGGHDGAGGPAVPSPAPPDGTPPAPVGGARGGPGAASHEVVR
uniref:hypothetical protein n=1 Tax=Aquipuribacter sp. SD81 TaxID=3127703 RepID=UPI003019CE22